MSYVKYADGVIQKYPCTISDLKKENPRTSFPKLMPSSGLPEYNVFPVTHEDKPSIDDRTQKAVKAQPVLDGGSWVSRWNVIDKTAEEITEYDSNVASKNRGLRNLKLSETDYYALTDVTMDAAMTSYRQALRDITTHENWPNLSNDDWPVKP